MRLDENTPEDRCRFNSGRNTVQKNSPMAILALLLSRWVKVILEMHLNIDIGNPQ